MNTQPNIATGNVTAGSHISIWTDTFSQTDQPVQPAADESADVVVVGAGISGLTTAYCLARSGKKVIVVDDGFIGSGETGRTTAHLVCALDDRYYHLEKVYGKENTKLIAQSHMDAIEFVETTIRTEKIDCDFTRLDGYLFLHPSDSPDSIQKEFEATVNAGINTRIVEQVPGIPSEKGKSLHFPSQAQFHPMKYIAGLSRCLLQMGGKIYTMTHAKEISKDGIVTEKGIRISAEHVVVATNTPVNNMVVMHLKQYPYRSYVIAALVKKGSLPKALWWDTGDFERNKNVAPYHYVRTQVYDAENDLLICGGEDHPTGLADAEGINEEDRYALLESWMRQRFNAGAVIYRWSGQVLEPMDSIAFIGRNPMDSNNIYIVTGDSGNGMTHGTIAGRLITDLINGVENPLEKIYNPSRFKFLRTGMNFLRQFAGGLSGYIKTYPRNADAVRLSAIKNDNGAVTELNGEKYGVYRDGSGKLHIVSADCTHMHCTVKWNGDEKTWDCPCHGSRFTYTGTVVNGPANVDLDYYTDADQIKD